MGRGYQHDFASNSPYVFDVEGRERKARTMVAVLEDYLPSPLSQYNLLNVGGSTGIIDNFLADVFGEVVGVDIDELAIRHAQESYRRHNLRFQLADAMNLPFDDSSFDIIVNSHVYEHVPDARRMFAEIHRVLKPGGICYFSAGNRLMWNEPHYNLPLLSVLPRPLAHVYIRLAGKARYYHEKHLTYWGLKGLVKRFTRIDYTASMVNEPDRFHTVYMLPPGSLKAAVAGKLVKYAYWAFPGYIWLLKK